MERIAYDEFSMFHENAEEWGLVYAGAPEVERATFSMAQGRKISALAWGQQPTDLVLVHGGAQNAHTYDTVALALDRPLLAIDLPGHGHSDGSPDGSTNAFANGEDLADIIDAHCKLPVTLVGMSLGGLSSIVAASRSEHLAQLVLIDITPGVTAQKASAITAFVNGPTGFADFNELLARTMEHNPGRSETSLRRGGLHNAIQLDDGTWSWRWALHRHEASEVRPETSSMWELLERLSIPITLVRGMGTGSVVDDADVAKLRSVSDSVEVIEVEGAGHSIQGDQPLILADIIRSLS